MTVCAEHYEQEKSWKTENGSHWDSSPIVQSKEPVKRITSFTSFVVKSLLKLVDWQLQKRFTIVPCSPFVGNVGL